MLNVLGWRLIHSPADERTARRIGQGHLGLSILEQYDALTVCALPIVAYRRYADLYPQAKFILTVRDVESWLVSIRRHWERADARHDWTDQRPHVRAARNYRFQVFGHLGFDAQHFRNIYSQHWQNVLLAFRNQTGRLLVFDVRDGWGPLCRFLGVREPRRAVPHLNKGNSV
jgi:hypothetical protein